jgi:hypothetical protein
MKAMKSPWPLALIAGPMCLVTATSLAATKVQTVLESGRPGPTVLLVDSPAANDIFGAIAIKQVSCWTLAKGRVVAATGKDLAEAVKAVTPAAVVMLEVEKTGNADSPSATVFAYGCAAVLQKKLNRILDHGTAPLQLAGDTPRIPPHGDPIFI